MCSAGLIRHADIKIPWPRDAITELNNDGMLKLGDVHYKENRIYHFFSEWDLINDDSSFCSQILLAILTCLQCHAFPFGKLFVKYQSLSVNGILDNAERLKYQDGSCQNY